MIFSECSIINTLIIRKKNPTIAILYSQLFKQLIINIIERPVTKTPKINQNKPNAEIVIICTSPYLLFSNCDKSTAAHEIQVRLTPSPT